MNYKFPTIVVVTHTRIFSIKRLLNSLKNANYSSDVRLIISIDGSQNNEELIKFCQEFHWDLGEKELIINPKQLGLVKHIFSCFDLTNKYGSIILFEDDQYVSKSYYIFAMALLNKYKDEKQISGFSLFNLSKNGFLNIPFYPLEENCDVYFIQLGFSHGTVITDRQWNEFKFWYENSDDVRINEKDNLHPFLFALDKKPDTEWLQTITKFLLINNKYFSYPRISHSVNFQDVGVHFDKQSNWYQNPIQYTKLNYKLKNIEECIAIYDSFFEIKPEKIKILNSDLKNYNFDMNLNATKKKINMNEQFVITTIKPKSFIKSYGKVMKPLEQNVIENIDGEGIYLTESSNLKLNFINIQKTKRENHYFYLPGQKFSNKISFFLLGLLSKLKII